MAESYWLFKIECGLFFSYELELYFRRIGDEIYKYSNVDEVNKSI